MKLILLDIVLHKIFSLVDHFILRKIKPKVLILGVMESDMHTLVTTYHASQLVRDASPPSVFFDESRFPLPYFHQYVITSNQAKLQCGLFGNLDMCKNKWNFLALKFENPHAVIFGIDARDFDQETCLEFHEMMLEVREVPVVLLCNHLNESKHSLARIADEFRFSSIDPSRKVFIQGNSSNHNAFNPPLVRFTSIFSKLIRSSIHFNE